MENRTIISNYSILGVSSSGTEDYVEDIFSSFRNIPVYFSNENNDEDYSSIEIVPQSSNRKVSDLDRLVARRIVANEEAERDRIVNSLVQELEMALELFGEEDEEYSSAERKIIEIEHKYKMRILGEVIQVIYLRYFDNPLYMVGICRSLLRYDLDEVKPWGATMLAGLLNHPDERVTEYTIQLIDNWSDIELLPLLKTIKVSSVWLNDYLKDVVKNLEMKNVLYQKVV